MTRTTGWVFVAIIALSLSAGAAVTPGSISGYVRDSAGVPQMGAAVEIYGTATGQHQLAYTDETGHFSLSGLLPGSYDLKASATSFLPTMREDIALTAGATKVLNITLNTLFEAVKMLPPAKRSGNEDDSWKWTLRSTANRPILRFDDGVPVVVESAQSERAFSGGLAFVAGGNSAGYASGSDLGTAFNLEHSISSDSTLGFNGTLGGYGGGIPDGILQVSYRRQGEDADVGPQMALSIRRFAAPQNGIRLGSLQALAFSYSNGFSIGELLDFRIGSEVQAIQFMGRVNAVRPYGTVDVHLARATMLEYKYTTSEPNQLGMGQEGPYEIAQSGPRMSLSNYDPLLENAHHHEVSLSQRIGDDNTVQVAYYRDRVKDPELLGVGEIDHDMGYFLPDVNSGTFSFTGGELQAQGVRFVYERKLGDSLGATLDYAYGGVLDLDQPGVDWSLVHDNLKQAWRHSAALKLNGKLNRSHTTWMASYRWISGQAVTPVDMFNASSGQTDPFLNFFVRQPLPRMHFFSGGHMEAVVDLRNLLAQGYVPMLGPDGKTVYLVQSARSVRGGVSFTF
jgi:hypothetical protein